jgi:hypothetical protein
LEKICREIDRVILATLPSSGLKAYGLCELVTKDKQQYPITVDITRQQAQIHDRFDGVFYHRFLSSTSSEDTENSFGLQLQDRIISRLRTFCAFNVKLGEYFIFDFINAIPRKTLISGFKFIHRSSALDLISDHEAVYNQEYGETTPYEKHRTTYNIYAIEYNMEFTLC